MASDTPALWWKPLNPLYRSLRGLSTPRRKIAQAIGENLPKPSDQVLEVGCADGLLLDALSKQRPETRFWGLDSDPYWQRRFRKRARANWDFLPASAQNLPFPNGTLDAVLAVFFFHQVLEAEKPPTLAALLHALKPGGRLLVVDFVPARDRLAQLQRFALKVPVFSSARGLFQGAFYGRLEEIVGPPQVQQRFSTAFGPAELKAYEKSGN